jgi:hypothetical protein
MEFIPEVHLEDWDIIEEEEFHTLYEKENLRIHESYNNENTLFIKDEEGVFRSIKKINNYWEFRSLDIYLNQESNSDDDNYYYQHDYFMYIRDNFQFYDYLIFDKSNYQVYGYNDLFDVNQNWADPEMEKNYKESKIFVLDVATDILPLKYENGWIDIDIKSYKDALIDGRDNKISEVLNI